MLNKIKYIIISFIFFFGLSINVNAENIIDFGEKGSIEVTLTEKSEDIAIKGADITIYQIAYATEENHNLKFEYTEALKDCHISLENLEDPNLPKELSKCLNENVLSITKTTDNNGVVNFENLDLGLYLVTQSNKVEGYSVIDPFLVMTPKIENDEWIYDIKALPKTDIYQVVDLKITKVWNTSSNNLPEKVEIELYKGDTLINTVILNKDNNWTYTFKDIEKSDEYHVKEINIPKGYTVSYQNQEFTFTVTNTDTLPQTGQIFYPIIILTVLGITFILLGFLELKRDNR